MKKKYLIFLNPLNLYYLTMTVSSVIAVAKTVVYAKLLPPIEMGYYSLFLLLSTYGVIVCSFGLYEGAMGIFPVWYGEEKYCKAMIARNEVAGFILISTFTLLIGAFIISLFFEVENPTFKRIFFLSAFFSGILSLFSLALADVRSRMRTHEFGIIMLLRSSLSLVSGLVSVHYFGYVGILFSEIFLTTILVILVTSFRIDQFRFKQPSIRDLLPLFRIGIPLMFSNVASNLAPSITQFFVVRNFGAYYFGQYNFSLLLDKGSALVRSTIYQYVGPKVLYEFGKGKSLSKILRRINYFAFFLVILSIVFWYPFSQVSALLIEQFFPEYSESIDLVKIMYFGAFLKVLSQYDGFIVAGKKTESLFTLNVLIISISTVLLYVGSLKNWPLAGYALVFVAGRALYLIGTGIMAFRTPTGASETQH